MKQSILFCSILVPGIVGLISGVVSARELQSQGMAVSDPSALAMTLRVAPVAPVDGATPIPKPTYTPIPGIVNPNFESGPGVGWTESSSDGSPLVDNTLPHTGSFSVHECGSNNCIGFVQQPLTIPDDAILTFWWYMSSQDSPTSAHDYFTVQAIGVDGTTQTLRTRNNTVRRNTWLQDTLNLECWGNKTLFLRFTTTTDAQNPTTFYVDDVELNIEAPEGTPTPTATPVSGNGVTNPGFEDGPGVGWNESSSGGFELIDSRIPHGGINSVYECGYDICSEYIQQQVTIPSNGSLSFWWYMTTEDSTTVAHDYFRVELYRVDGSLLSSLRMRNNLVRSRVWLQDTVYLPAWAGQTVLVRFTTTTDSANPTSFFVDDVVIHG